MNEVILGIGVAAIVLYAALVELKGTLENLRKLSGDSASAECLRPQAKFARSSGRGLRRVQNLVQAGKGMCKKR